MSPIAKANYANAKNLYPSCQWGEAEWVVVFERNPEIMWAIIGDIYDAAKTEQERDAGIVRIGRRPARTGTNMDDVWQTVFPTQYSVDPFPEAFAKLINGRSQRTLARRIPCSQAAISRLLNGQSQPDLVMLERIAQACRVPPHFFVEYRAMLIGAMVTKVLTEQPNMGVTAMKRVRASRRDLLGAPS